MSTPRATAQIVADLLGAGRATVIDVGARWGASDAWWRLAPLAKVLGFDPDPGECARLNALCEGKNETYVPLALGARAEVAQLHITSEPACSSLYPPIEALAHRYPELSCLRVTRTESIHLARLDDWARGANAGEISFMKLDTQGAEFDILQGAENVLRNCVGLEIEVEFSPLYAGQPLFSDLDPWLRERGFSLWRIENLAHYSEHFSQPDSGDDSRGLAGWRQQVESRSGRIYWAHAVYFRDYAEMQVTDGDYSRMLVLAALLSAKGDLAAATACIQRVLHEDGSLSSDQRETLEAHQADLFAQMIEGTGPTTQAGRLSNELHEAHKRLLQLDERLQQTDRQLASYGDVSPFAIQIARKLTGVSKNHPRLSAAMKSLLPRRKTSDAA